MEPNEPRFNLPFLLIIIYSKLPGKGGFNETLLNPSLLLPILRDLCRGWEAQGFPIPEVDFPSLEFLKCKIIEMIIVLMYWNMSDFPLLKASN